MVFSVSGECIVGGFLLMKTFDNNTKSLANVGKF